MINLIGKVINETFEIFIFVGKTKKIASESRLSVNLVRVRMRLFAPTRPKGTWNV